MLRLGRLGGAVLRLAPAAELLARGLAIAEARPDFALTASPQHRHTMVGDAEGGVQQRGRLRRARWDAEPFTLAAAASLAGRYVPEMAEALQAAGVAEVELDAVQVRLRCSLWLVRVPFQWTARESRVLD